MTDHILRNPDRFTVGAIGEVGGRVFLLQGVKGLDTITIKVEKQQIAVLATYLTRALDSMGRPGHLPDDLELILSPDDDIDLIAGEGVLLGKRPHAAPGLDDSLKVQSLFLSFLRLHPHL
ncbi:MAG: DUF3090 family protein [Actinomycetes bacterium]